MAHRTVFARFAVCVLAVVLWTSFATATDEKTAQLQAELDKAKKEIEALKKEYAATVADVATLKKAVEELRQQNKVLELKNKLLELTLDAAVTKQEAAAVKAGMKVAERELEAAKKDAERSAKKLEEFIKELSEMKGGVPSLPPPPLPNLRAEVLEVAGDSLTISAGLDAGLAVGTVLDVYRLENGGRYLGTAKVMKASDVQPKQAVVTFTSARKDLPLEMLTPDQRPKKGDLVRPVEAPSSKP